MADAPVRIAITGAGLIGRQHATRVAADTIAAPWSWEFTSGENPAYSRTPETFMMIGGTKASLAIPSLDLWSHPGEPDWFTPIDRVHVATAAADPLALQVRNRCDVVRGRAQPVAPGREGLQTLRVILAIQQAAASGHPHQVRHAA